MVDGREFVRVWQTSSSLSEVAQKTRSKKAACRIRANRYRALGIPLKEFPPPAYMTSEDYYGDLRQYAASFLPGEDPAGASV
jgi:hypothetical protein